jgi:hypothetical protein
MYILALLRVELRFVQKRGGEGRREGGEGGRFNIYDTYHPMPLSRNFCTSTTQRDPDVTKEMREVLLLCLTKSTKHKLGTYVQIPS